MTTLSSIERIVASASPDLLDRAYARARLKYRWERRLIWLLTVMTAFLAGMAFCHLLNMGVH